MLTLQTNQIEACTQACIKIINEPMPTDIRVNSGGSLTDIQLYCLDFWKNQISKDNESARSLYSLLTDIPMSALFYFTVDAYAYAPGYTNDCRWVWGNPPEDKPMGFRFMACKKHRLRTLLT